MKTSTVEDYINASAEDRKAIEDWLNENDLSMAVSVREYVPTHPYVKGESRYAVLVEEIIFDEWGISIQWDEEDLESLAYGLRLVYPKTPFLWFKDETDD